jgi:hypothetical protein
MYGVFKMVTTHVVSVTSGWGELCVYKLPYRITSVVILLDL